MKKIPVPDEVYGRINAKRGFIRFGPSSWPPIGEDETILVAEGSYRDVSGVNSYAVLLDRRDFTALLAWLCRVKSGSYEIQSVQQKAVMVRGSDGLKITIGYPYMSGWTFSTSVFLTPKQVGEVIDWMSDKDINGWSGWYSGRTSEPEENGSAADDQERYLREKLFQRRD